LTHFHIPSQNKDHIIEFDGDNPFRTMKVIKGRKTLRQLLDEEMQASNLPAPQRATLRTKYRL